MMWLALAPMAGSAQVPIAQPTPRGDLFPAPPGAGFDGFSAPVAPAPVRYEAPLPASAASLIGENQMVGPGYRVDRTAQSDGMLYSFNIDTDRGPMKVESLQMMRVRLTELAAINRLRELSEEPLFLQGMGKQLENTVEATGKAIRHPVQTLKQIPVGFKKFKGEIQAQQAVGTVYGESGSQAYSQVKRELAYKLGVDPYSDNPVLQDLLNNVAKNQNRGQLVASIGTLVVGGGAGVALAVVEMNDEFNQIIKNKSAAQLQIENSAALESLVCKRPQMDRLLNMPGYTASNSTAITRAMTALARVRGICGVLDTLPPNPMPEAALLAQTQIQMAAQFHTKERPLTSVRFVEGTAVWADAQGNSYVFTPLEYLYWNEEIDHGFRNIRQAIGGGTLELWISGTATPTAQTEMLRNHNAIVRPGSFATLYKR